MGNPPEGYLIGTEFTREQIDEAIKQPTVPMRMQIVPSVDVSGHGTSVAGIAAGNGRGSRGRIYRGVATQSELLVVKLGNPREKDSSHNRTNAGDRLRSTKSTFYKQPVAINISFGNTYGSMNLIIKGKHKKTLIFPVFSGDSVLYSDSCLVVIWVYNTRSGSC